MAEKYLRYYAREIDTQTVTLRLANVYGPGPLGGRVDRGILNGMIYKALQGEVLTIYGDGAFLRDYVFIDDVVNAFFLVSSRMPLVNGNYYIIGSGQGVRIVDAVRMVADRVEWKTGRRPAIAHVPPPDVLSAIETRNFVANTTGFRTATGWEPRISLKEGIDLTINHLIVERT
jgi:nucleoside-diphosphate-sugar epimerase